MHRAAGYFRVSSKAQATEKNVSLDVQRERFIAYCTAHALLPAATYTDVLSGRRDDRRQYQAMLRTIERGELDAVVVMFLDRFGRSTEEILFQVLRLKRLGIEVFCTDEDLSSLVHLFLSSWKAGEESARTGERVRAAALRRIRTGHRWGKIPWGFRIAANGAVELDPAPSGAVRRAARLILDDNLGLRQVAQRLNDDGFRRRHGEPWDAASVRLMLIRECNLGIVSFAKPGGKKNRDGEREYASTDQALPAILDRATYDAVIQRLTERNRWPAGRSQRSPFLLTGLLKCGLCGARMHGVTLGATRVYRCGAHVMRKSCVYNYQNAGKTETIVLAELAHCSDPEHAVQYIPEIEPEPDCSAERADITAALAALETDFLKAFRAYTSGLIADEQQYRLANQDLRDRQHALQARLAALDAADREAADRAARRAAFPEQIRSFVETYTELSIQQQKAALAELIERIAVWPDHRIRVDYRIGTRIGD